MPEKAKKILNNVHPDFSFKLKSGGELRNLNELMHALKKMERDTFLHHVTSEKNDFARWVKDILHDDELAAELGYCKDQENMEEVVRCRILELHAKIQKHEDFKSFEGLLPPEDDEFSIEREDHKEANAAKEARGATHAAQKGLHSYIDYIGKPHIGKPLYTNKDGEEEEENSGLKTGLENRSPYVDYSLTKDTEKEIAMEKTKEADSLEEAEKLFGFSVTTKSVLKLHWFLLGMTVGFMVGVLIGLWLG